jgi:hypothetical protein
MSVNRLTKCIAVRLPIHQGDRFVQCVVWPCYQDTIAHLKKEEPQALILGCYDTAQEAWMACETHLQSVAPPLESDRSWRKVKNKLVGPLQ